MSKRTSYGKIYRPDVRTRPHLPHGRDFTHGRFLPSALVKIRPRGRNPASARTRHVRAGELIPSPPIPSPSPPLPSPPLQTQSIRVDAQIIFLNNNKFFLGSWCQLEKNLVFGFQSPRSPSSPGFTGEAARRRRFFRPSSPSHPSKLYSSLGWLNSKVPKPFSPFSLRLIDVDGF
jgi:hypothetical protein